MKIIYWGMLFLLFPLALFATDKRPHEIGLGVGTIMLNPYNESALLNNDQKWTFNTVFRQNSYRHWMIDPIFFKSTYSYSTPVFYYSNKVSNRTALRFSYQHAYQKGLVANRFQNEQGEAATFRYMFKQSNLHVGFSFAIVIKKHLDIYVASEIETVLQKKKEDRIILRVGVDDFYQYVQENTDDPTTQVNFYLNQLVGLRIPLTKRVNIRYEFSGKFVDVEARLQPINRLSVNYSF